MRIFLSYRRADDLFLAGRLRDRLAEDFGEENVFFDVDSIPPGTDFREVTRERIDAADVVLVLIGSRWDTTRLARSNDYVRMELGESVRQHKPLIPVLIADTAMPEPDELPEELVTIAFRHALRIRPDPDFHDDSARLVEAVRRANERELARQAKEHKEREPTVSAQDASPLGAAGNDITSRADAGPTQQAGVAADAEIAGRQASPGTAERAATVRRRRWALLAAAVVAAGGIAVVAWAAGGDSNRDRQFEIAPNAGPLGTTIELRGDGCPAAPNDAVNRGLNYWLDSTGGELANADVDGDYDAPWTGSLVVPAGGPAEAQYWVGAACWAVYDDGSDRNFYEYPTVPFDLVES